MSICNTIDWLLLLFYDKYNMISELCEWVKNAKGQIFHFQFSIILFLLSVNSYFPFPLWVNSSFFFFFFFFFRVISVILYTPSSWNKRNFQLFYSVHTPSMWISLIKSSSSHVMKQTKNLNVLWIHFLSSQSSFHQNWFLKQTDIDLTIFLIKNIS